MAEKKQGHFRRFKGIAKYLIEICKPLIVFQILCFAKITTSFFFYVDIRYNVV